MKTEHRDETFMRLALREARKGVGRTSPNPAVGAVIVLGGRVIARGWHQGAGLPHAEIAALQSLKRRNEARHATIYITLEPCCTQGRTGPCTTAIIAAGIIRVVFGATDLNPSHQGRAIAILKEAGLQVTFGILQKECTALNPGFNKWIATGRPLVIAKAGLSLDGRLTRRETQWITNDASRADAMRLRAGVDAILIGAGTLRADNPKLTIRDVGISKIKQPLRVVVSRSGPIPKNRHLFTDAFRDRTVVYQRKSLGFVLEDLAKRGCTAVMIEGGGEILGAALDQRLVDRVQFYIAPMFCGGPDVISGIGAPSTLAAPNLANVKYRRFGDDIRVTGDVVY